MSARKFDDGAAGRIRRVIESSVPTLGRMIDIMARSSTPQPQNIVVRTYAPARQDADCDRRRISGGVRALCRL